MTTAVTEAPVVSVGDFFYASWGYDQTNVDFYKVVGVTPKGVKIQQWTSRVDSANDYSMRVVPGDKPYTMTRWVNGERVGEIPASVEQKRLHHGGYDGRPYLSWRSYADLYFWNGQPKDQTDPRCGH